MIKFDDVSKKFGSIVALEDVSFEVSKGEFVFISGPSGSGKTTILKLILGEFKPSTGKIIVLGENINKLQAKTLPFYRQKIGTVFQDFKILSTRTLRENIEIALAVIGLPENAWDDRIAHILKLVNLSKQINLFPNQLSGGELQRLSLARALSVNPEIILADEPTGNLDWKTSGEIMDLFEKINKEGKTIVMVTHNLDIVKKHKKRIIHLDGGKITK